MIARILRTTIAALPLTAVFAGCSIAYDAPPVPAEHADSIINGTRSGPEDDAAVWFGILDSAGHVQGACTGVLLAENVVMTARHCVSRTQAGGIECSRDGKPVSGGAVLSDNPANSVAVIVGTRSMRKVDARGARVFTTGAKSLCNNDIALVVLDRKIPSAKIAPVRLVTPPVKGANITAVGWGISNDTGYFRRRRAGIPILAVGPSSSAGGAVAPNEFAIGEGICQGDSGGPAFDEKTGAVIGIVSRGGNGDPSAPAGPVYASCIDNGVYLAHNIFSRSDSFKALILSAFEDSGSEPWIEGGPDPRKAKLGDPCDTPDSCRSALCVDLGSRKICSQRCESTPCPAGYDCVTSGDARVCAPSPATADPALASAGATGNSSKCTLASPPGAGVNGAAGGGVPPGDSFGLVKLVGLGTSLLASVRRRRRGLRAPA